MRRVFLFLTICLSLFALVASASAAPKGGHARPAEKPVEQPPPDPPPAAAEPPQEKEAEEDAMPATHPPVTMKVGILVNELSKLDLAAQTFNVEMLVQFVCDVEPCKPDLDIENGKLLGKPEKLEDQPLRKIYKVKAEVSADIDLSEYPFDHHALPITLVDKGDPEQIKYTLDESAGAAGLKDNIKLAGWELVGWDAAAIEEDIGDGQKIGAVHFYIEAQRPRTMALFKTVVPVLIMLFVAAFTLLLKPKSAAGRLSAATGGFMALVMFQVGQVGSLPPVQSLTRFDKFMLATYLVYLANIAFSVAMVRLEEKKNERLSELMYLAAAGAVPGVALLAWTTVFLRIV